MTAQADVVILGGGPAGLSTAAALARRGRAVVLLERGEYAAARAGETFGGEVRPLLQELSALELFAAVEQVPFRGVRSAWGSAALESRASIVKPLGEGFHVERAQFDAILARCAVAAGAAVHTGAGVCSVEATESGFRVASASGVEVAARLLVDASGRGASASAAVLGASRWISFDRLVAVVAIFAPRAPPEPELLLESAEQGWWYAVPQPGGALLVALLTDADLAVPAGPRAELPARFADALSRTVHIQALVDGTAAIAAPRLVRADSGFLLSDRGERFRAVGDAAFACDPLAGDGVARALRSGLEAARDLDAALDGRADAPEAAAAAKVLRFEAYLDRRASYYAAEPRFSEALFWSRRRAPRWADAPLVLHPLQRLRWDGLPPDLHRAAQAESLLPRRAIQTALEHLREARPAHEALAALRAAAPLEDRRLLVGLQLLVARGCVTAV
jgi:flavin-dependent dehydrogenase